MPENAAPLPDFTRWPSFPFEGDMRVKDLAAPVAVEPPRSGEDASDCVACNTPDDAYIWENERWRVRAMDRPTGLPMVLILECRSHLDMGDLPNLLAAELGVMTVRLERAIRSLDGVARVHVNRWGDGSAHLHMWFLARPYGRLQLRGTFLSLWDDILPTIPEDQWRENLALVAAWLAEFGGQANTEPAHIQWQSPSTFSVAPLATGPGTEYGSVSSTEPTEPTAAESAGTYALIESESGAFPDAGPATDGVPDSGDNESEPLGANNTDSSGTGSSILGGPDALVGSGSDHGSSPADESAAVAETSETRASARATESFAEPRSDAQRADASADSDEGSAGVWVTDAEKGLWRPNDLGEAERPEPAVASKTDSSPAATTEDFGDRATVLPDPHTDAGEDGSSAETSSDRAADPPRTDAETLAASSSPRKDVDPTDDDTAAETAGTRRS